MRSGASGEGSRSGFSSTSDSPSKPLPSHRLRGNRNRLRRGRVRPRCAWPPLSSPLAHPSRLKSGAMGPARGLRSPGEVVPVPSTPPTANRFHDPSRTGVRSDRAARREGQDEPQHRAGACGARVKMNLQLAGSRKRERLRRGLSDRATGPFAPFSGAKGGSEARRSGRSRDQRERDRTASPAGAIPVFSEAAAEEWFFGLSPSGGRIQSRRGCC